MTFSVITCTSYILSSNFSSRLFLIINTISCLCEARWHHKLKHEAAQSDYQTRWCWRGGTCLDKVWIFGVLPFPHYHSIKLSTLCSSLPFLRHSYFSFHLRLNTGGWHSMFELRTWRLQTNASHPHLMPLVLLNATRIAWPVALGKI